VRRLKYTGSTHVTPMRGGTKRAAPSSLASASIDGDSAGWRCLLARRLASRRAVMAAHEEATAGERKLENAKNGRSSEAIDANVSERANE